MSDIIRGHCEDGKLSYDTGVPLGPPHAPIERSKISVPGARMPAINFDAGGGDLMECIRMLYYIGEIGENVHGCRQVIRRVIRFSIVGSLT